MLYISTHWLMLIIIIIITVSVLIANKLAEYLGIEQSPRSNDKKLEFVIEPIHRLNNNNHVWYNLLPATASRGKRVISHPCRDIIIT